MPQDVVARLATTLWNERVAEIITNGSQERARELKELALMLMPFANKYKLYFENKVDDKNV